MSHPRRPTSKDVALLSGVSQPMVSYVFNDTPGKRVSQATRQRILEAADELGYVPSKAAQNLVRGRSSVVILDVPPGPDATVAPAFYAALSPRLAQAGWTIVSHYGPRQGHEGLDRLVRATQADAVLAGNPDDDRYRPLRDRGIIVQPLIDDQDFDRVSLPVIRQLEHLTSLSHRHLAFAAPDSTDEARAVEHRLVTIREWLRSRDLPPVTELAWTGDLDAFTSQVRNAVQGRRITAIAAHNDAVAMPVLAAAHALSLDIPRDLAVIGIDDSPLARVTSPPLTTVRWDFTDAVIDQFAQRVVSALTRQSGPGSPSDEAPLRFTVVRRQTT